MNSTAGTHLLPIPRCRPKHRNSGRKSGFSLFQRSWKRHSGDAAGTASSPVNFRRQGSPKCDLSARKLAAGLWQLRFMEVSGDNGGASSFPFHFSNSELQSSAACLKCSKQDVALSEAYNVFAKIRSRELLLGERKVKGDCDSVVSALLAELLRAQRCINKLKAEHKSSNQKVEPFVLKLQDEMVFWKHKQHKKIQSMLDDLKDKLARERRSRERMELLNTKLIHDLAKANLSAKQFMTSYEEEKKQRELTEEVYNELAMQIGEDRAKLERLKRDSMKIREEVEEERKMFQMTELWREERIQMKLLDAKVALEDKYNQMMQLMAYLQNFLRSRGDGQDKTMELRDAHLIKHAAESINIQCVTAELAYDLSKSNDVFSIYEELRKDLVNLDEDSLNRNSVLHQTSTSSNHYIAGLEVNDSLEAVIHVEDQSFHSPPQMRDPDHDNVNLDKNILLGSEAECSDLELLNIGRINEVSSVPEILRSSEGGFRQKEILVEQNSSETMNPHITRGMKGCIKWPRGIPKTNSKTIPLEERVRSQKSQLQHILKPKA